jgi:type IV secretory pathway VirB6-like protein
LNTLSGVNNLGGFPMANILDSLYKWATDVLDSYEADSNKSLGMFSNTKGQGGSEYAVIVLVAVVIAGVVGVVITAIVRSHAGDVESHWYTP